MNSFVAALNKKDKVFLITTICIFLILVAGLVYMVVDTQRNIEKEVSVMGYKYVQQEEGQLLLELSDGSNMTVEKGDDNYSYIDEYYDSIKLAQGSFISILSSILGIIFIAAVLFIFTKYRETYKQGLFKGVFIGLLIIPISILIEKVFLIYSFISQIEHMFSHLG